MQNILEFVDVPGSPNNPAIFEFATELALVNAGGGFGASLARFTWQWTNNPNPNATVSARRRVPQLVPTSENLGTAQVLSINGVSLPEPSTAALLTLGLVGANYAGRRRTQLSGTQADDETLIICRRYALRAH